MILRNVSVLVLVFMCLNINYFVYSKNIEYGLKSEQLVQSLRNEDSTNLNNAAEESVELVNFEPSKIAESDITKGL